MDVLEVAPGLWRWTAAHPNAANWPVDAEDGQPWPEEVGCVYYEAPDAAVLIDPLVPGGQEERFLAHLDRDVQRLGRPVTILVTSGWHRRSSDALAARYGASIVTDDPLPQGVESYPILGAPERQVAYFIRPHGALVVAEIFAVDRAGVLELRPSPALVDRAALDRSLQSLLELPVKRLLVSHGEPVLEDALAAMHSALDRAQTP